MMTKDEAKRHLQAAKIMLLGKDGQPISDLYEAICVALDAIDAIEAADKRIAELEAQMPKDGEWITTRTENHDGEIYCSVCDVDAPTEGDYRQVKTNYCPNCGAKMDGERKDGERGERRTDEQQ